jgi:RNA polymerase sigma-70 factor (ECF subfamily)
LAAEVVDKHKEIAVRLQKGDKTAQQELYKLYSRAMFNICMRIVNQRENAEDILQEVFLTAFKQIHRFRFDSTIGAWLKRITINHCINFIKRKQNQMHLVDTFDSFDRPETDEPVDWEDIQLSVEAIHKAMMLLPEGCRVIFSLFMLEGYDHAEISQILEISESTSKSQLNRAKNLIRSIITNTNKLEQWKVQTS